MKGLFDRIRLGESGRLSVPQATLLVMLAAIRAHGEASAASLRRLSAVCAGIRLFALESRAEEGVMVASALRLLDEVGDPAIDRAINRLSPAQRATAFALTADVTLAAGRLGEREEAYLHDLAERMAIPLAEAEVLVHGALIRNRAGDD